MDTGRAGGEGRGGATVSGLLGGAAEDIEGGCRLLTGALLAVVAAGLLVAPIMLRRAFTKRYILFFKGFFHYFSSDYLLTLS